MRTVVDYFLERGAGHDDISAPGRMLGSNVA
jgi:hypothetical protein